MVIGCGVRCDGLLIGGLLIVCWCFWVIVWVL